MHDVAFLRHARALRPRLAALTRRGLPPRGAPVRTRVVCVVARPRRADAAALLGRRPRAGRGGAARPGPGRAAARATRPRARGHLLYVATPSRARTCRGLLAAYAAYRRAARGPAALVLAGAAASRAARAPGVDGARRRPAPRSWPSCCAARAALVHPSLHEGFGLTLLEAMALGVPVRGGAQRRAREEVCGDAALLVEPRRAWRRRSARVAGDAALREELVRARQPSGHATFSLGGVSAAATCAAYTLARARRPDYPR